jgi:hypothetical protein
LGINSTANKPSNTKIAAIPTHHEICRSGCFFGSVGFIGTTLSFSSKAWRFSSDNLGDGSAGVGSPCAGWPPLAPITARTNAMVRFNRSCKAANSGSLEIADLTSSAWVGFNSPNSKAVMRASGSFS